MEKGHPDNLYRDTNKVRLIRVFEFTPRSLDVLQPSQLEDLVCLISSLDRSALLLQFHTYPARFPIDFTDQFLNTQSVDRLRHIFLAMCITNQRMPESPANQAA